MNQRFNSVNLLFTSLICRCGGQSYSQFYPFTDPSVESNTWMFEQINVIPVWEEGFTGKGIHIRINDKEGVDASHPDFANHFDVASSCPGEYLPEDYGNDDHGTRIASIAAASGDDGSCSVGIAPGATLSSCAASRSSGPYWSPPPGGKDIDIVNYSQGVEICETKPDFYYERRLQNACPFSGENNPCQMSSCADEDWGQAIETEECRRAVGSYCSNYLYFDQAGCTSYLDIFTDCSYSADDLSSDSDMLKSITEGRDGKGTVHVFSAGNEFYQGEVINFEGRLNSRFTIKVGATKRDGRHARYSTPGVALFVSAPGEDQIAARNGGGCLDAGVGTSLSAPVVAGVVALVLEANPDLGWRDVQGIFALTSQKVLPDDPTWITNGGGLHHSILWGFGIVDAKAAVDKAKTWTNYSLERVLSTESGAFNIVINDFPAPEISSTVTVANPDGIITENIEVLIELDHASRGDLDITLTSPSGTKSLLVPGNRPENGQPNTKKHPGPTWKLLTVRHWGEDPSGEWTLSIEDISEGNHEDCIDYIGWWDQTDTYHCAGLEELNICADGGPGPNFASLGVSLEDLEGWKYYHDEDPWTNAGEACCACGGGTAAADFPNALKSWKLVVYGHDKPVSGFCFSAYTLVQREDGTVLQMKDLSLGDRVLVSNGKYESIYSFGHFDTSVVKAEFFQIQTSSSLGLGLEITPGHLVFTEGNQAVPASSIKIGDKLMMASGKTDTVISIQIVSRTGIFAPFTFSGTIVTNGVLSSSFATIQESRYVSLGGFEIPLTYHQLGVVFESPHRLFCILWGLDECARYERYNKEGMSEWVEKPMIGFQWLLRQNIIISGVLLFIAFAFLCMMNLIEMIVVNPLFTTFFMVVLITGCHHRGKRV